MNHRFQRVNQNYTLLGNTIQQLQNDLSTGNQEVIQTQLSATSTAQQLNNTLHSTLTLFRNLSNFIDTLDQHNITPQLMSTDNKIQWLNETFIVFYQEVIKSQSSAGNEVQQLNSTFNSALTLFQDLSNYVASKLTVGSSW